MLMTMKAKERRRERVKIVRPMRMGWALLVRRMELMKVDILCVCASVFAGCSLMEIGI